MRRAFPWIFAALAAVLLPCMAEAQNLLDDGDLDLATSGTQTSNSDWVLTVNFPDTVNPAARFQTGFGNANNTGAGGTQAPGTGTGVWFRAFEGDQGNSGEPLADATLTQDVTAPVSGDYRLDFVAGIEGIPNFTVTDFSVSLSSDGTGGTSSLDIIANSGSIIDGNIGGAASNNKGGTPFSIKLFGVTAGDTLTVTGQMLGGEDSLVNPQSGFLDEFSLISVPEPTSALMAVFAALGFVARRRR